jgi:protein-tyrosine phosphatase
VERHLVWDGCVNVRDLGGYPTVDGHRTRWGAVVRSDAPDRLSESGRAALRNHGVRTIVDLRDPSERDEDHTALVEEGVERILVPLIDFANAPFWEESWKGGTYDLRGLYIAMLESEAPRFVAGVRTVARAQPGAVLIHCRVGRDRTGLLAALLLALVGVSSDAIAQDYAHSAHRLRTLYTKLIKQESNDVVRERLRQENVSDAGVIKHVLGKIDVHAHLMEHGLQEEDVALLVQRLVA